LRINSSEGILSNQLAPAEAINAWPAEATNVRSIAAIKL
jgi:hypothetical protein